MADVELARLSAAMENPLFADDSCAAVDAVRWHIACRLNFLPPKCQEIQPPHLQIAG